MERERIEAEPSLKQRDMDALAQDIIDNDVCLELREQAIQLVMGSGNLNADIVFIGEAPGQKEDEQGVPFVGRSGKLLDEMLAEAGMDRDDVYITNIVKYRPPNNRDPKPEEKAAFWPYLMRQLDIINPKVVITLGGHSTGSFLPDVKIGEVHGEPADVALNGRIITVVPLYHPAYALYNGSNRETLKADFLKTAARIAAA